MSAFGVKNCLKRTQIIEAQNLAEKTSPYSAAEVCLHYCNFRYLPTFNEHR